MNELNWTFEVGLKLRENKIPFELEKNLPAGRVDIAICSEKKLFGVIECKKKKIPETSFQFCRYKSMGVPFRLTFFGDDLKDLVEMCQIWVEKGGRRLSEVWTCRKVVCRAGNVKRLIRKQPEYDEDLNIKP